MRKPRSATLLRLCLGRRIPFLRNESGTVLLTRREWAEIERRRAGHRRDPSSSIPWEVVRHRLREQFR